MATGDLEHEAAQAGARQEDFWVVLERVAALGGDGARLRRPIPFEVVPDDAKDADPPRVPAGPAPREVYQQLRSLLSDVDAVGEPLGSAPGDGPEPEAPLVEDPTGAATSDEAVPDEAVPEEAVPDEAVPDEAVPEEAVESYRGDDVVDVPRVEAAQDQVVAGTTEDDVVDVPREEDAPDEADGGEAEGADTSSSETAERSRPVWLSWQEVPAESDEVGDAQAVGPRAGTSAQASSARASSSDACDDAGYGIGAHAGVIPGTEEFMALLERKNRAFEETGEIDADLDRAADRLAWDRATDDVIAKRKLFRKRKRD